MFLKAGVACCLVMAAALGAADRARIDRAGALASDRLTQWLGPAPSSPAETMQFATAVWSSPVSMALESQAAFQLARARFASIVESAETQPFLDGVAWHLQARIVEDLFDLEHQRPGHHAIDIPMFGDHVTWAVPSLVVARRARDERVPAGIANAANAFVTLEHAVGWPAFAAALRGLASRPVPVDRNGIEASLESTLGVPVDWFMAALVPGFRVNHKLAAVAIEDAACGSETCARTTIEVVREGEVLFPDEARAGTLGIPLRLDFDAAPASTIWWNGRDNARLIVESAKAPVAVTLDPDGAIGLDTNRHDQRWLAAPAVAATPVKALAAWMVWLQNALLTYAVLL